jgi:FAD binding domain
MAGLQAMRTSKGRAVLKEKVLDEFRARLRGDLLHPGDDCYDAARKIWNAMIDKRPALIGRCVGAADVIQCVNFAREYDLVVSVRGGGHNVAGHALCDGGSVRSAGSRYGSHDTLLPAAGDARPRRATRPFQLLEVQLRGGAERRGHRNDDPEAPDLFALMVQLRNRLAHSYLVEHAGLFKNQQAHAELIKEL